LHKFFKTDKKNSGMQKRLENINFTKDLALMIDILIEISLLSNASQARNIDLLKARNFIIRHIKAFEILKCERGKYEKKVNEHIN
jgi:hypothetical protein